MSTDAPTSGEVEPRTAYKLHRKVALRREPFGALAYHYGNRRLTFLRSQRLVDLLQDLDGETAIGDAIASGSPDDRSRTALSRAVESLARSDFLEKAPLSDTLADHPHSAAPGPSRQPAPASASLGEELKRGLEAPICLTWELTYGCNLACVHCLSSSGRRDPRELSSAQAMSLVDDLAAARVFYVNIGGGEPTIRPDFFDLVSYAVENGVGVKFSTNGTTMSTLRARRLADMDYVDVQVSVDGASAATNDPVRGEGSFEAATAAMGRLAEAGFGPFKISVVVTRHNVSELDDLLALSQRFGAELRLTRLRPAGRGAQSWRELHPTPDQQRTLHRWLVDHGEVLTGDSFFHLSAFGESLPGLNLCGAGRVVCLIDPVGDVYACPFAMHPEFRAGSVLDPGGFSELWRNSSLFTDLRRPVTGGACNACGSFESCQGGCMAAKFFTGLALDGPDPECVLGHGERALEAVHPGFRPPRGQDHSKPGRSSPVPISLGRTR